jgi:hypothetical protein
MTYAAQLRIAIAALMCAVVAAPAALGAGEPKNQPPFIRQVGNVVERHVAGTTNTDAAGEPKNQWPFIRPIERVTASALQAPSAGVDVASEPKNDVPFVRGVSSTPLLVRTSDGFDWSDAGIGAAAVLALGGLALGAFALRAGTHRRPRATGV